MADRRPPPRVPRYPRDQGGREPGQGLGQVLLLALKAVEMIVRLALSLIELLLRGVFGGRGPSSIVKLVALLILIVIVLNVMGIDPLAPRR
jgi:hypothetical protein